MPTFTRSRANCASRARRPAGIAALCLASLLPLAGHAHHSAAMFEEHKTVTIEGSVSRYEWSNPHVYIYVMQTVRGAPPVEWEVEGSPPSILRRLGWSQDTLHVGDAVQISGKPARVKRGDTTLFDRKAELGQLTHVEPATQAPAAGPTLEGVWVTLLDVQLEDKLDPQHLSLTKEGSKAFKRFDEKKMHPGARCEPNPAPVLMLTPDLKRITKGAGVLYIDGEFDGARRTIFMEQATHAGAQPSLQGHSIGHWNGASLSIDTVQFAPYALGDGYGLPSGSMKHLVESLTPTADGSGLTYRFEMTDPQFLAAAVSGEVHWAFRPSMKYAPEKCDLANARRYVQH
jgi:hypothetical protein